MKRSDVICLLATVLSLCAGPSRAGEYVCEGVVLQDAHALENPAAVMRQGERVAGIVRYQVNKKTGADWYCARGGCYQAHVIVDGANVEAIHLANCRIGDPALLEDPNSPSKDYSIELLAAGDPSKALSFHEIDTRLGRMGLCESCSNNARESYMRDPQSRCGQLVGKAMAGDAPAKKTFAKNFPDYCWLSDPKPPMLGPDAKPAAPFAGRYVAGSEGYSQELTRGVRTAASMSAPWSGRGAARARSTRAARRMGTGSRRKPKRMTRGHASSSFAARKRA